MRLGSATAIGAAIVAASAWWVLRAPDAKPAAPPVASKGGLKADDVQIDRELVSSFDAVARLPTGEPIRFRFREWMDRVVVEDKHRGLRIEQRNPRVEIVPVRFDTY